MSWKSYSFKNHSLFNCSHIQLNSFRVISEHKRTKVEWPGRKQLIINDFLNFLKIYLLPFSEYIFFVFTNHFKHFLQFSFLFSICFIKKKICIKFEHKWKSEITKHMDSALIINRFYTIIFSASIYFNFIDFLKVFLILFFHLIIEIF